MCQELPASIAPRIIAVLAGESMPWTGNEILGRIASDDSPCELHFDEALRQLLREKLVTSESDPWASNLTSTTRCRLAYTLTAEARQASLARPIPAAPRATPKPEPVAAALPTPVRPALPSPAVRLEVIGRLREEKVLVEAEWKRRFGADCFRSGPPGFIKALFLKARVQGMVPRFRDALERARGRSAADFERHSDKLLQLNDRDGTIPEHVLDAGVRLDPTHYVALDLDRAEQDVKEGREGSPANAREILAFLRNCVDDASLDRFRPGTAPAAGPGAPAAKSSDPLIDRLPVAPQGSGPMKPESPRGRVAALSIIAGSLALAAGLGAALWLWRMGEKPPPTTTIGEGGTPAGPRPGPGAPPAGDGPRNRSAILDTHAPDEKDLEGLEQLLALSRASLAARSGYRFDEAVDRLVDFRREKSLSPWLALFVDAEIDRFRAAQKVFQIRPLLNPKEETEIEFRDGRKVRGRVVGEESGRLIVDCKESGREPVSLSQVAPSTFSAARGRTLEAIQIGSSAGDAARALPLLDGLEELPRRILQPLLLDQSIEELLRTGDIAKIAAFRIPAPHRAVAETLLPSRLRDLTQETDAGAVYPHLEEDGALDRLLTTYAGTRAGTRAAAETLSRFEQSLPSEETSELVSAGAWGTWNVDRRDAPGGSIVLDKPRNVYGMSTPSAKEQVRLLQKLRGAQKGYRIRWSFGSGSSDAPAFMVALSLTRWLQLEPKGLILYRVDKAGGEDRVTMSGRTEFSERVSGGVLHVIPKAGLVLVYFDGRLVLALPGKDYALAGGLQLGMSGGSLTLESIRVLDRSGD
jgi:hypothetical protein